ncbi:helix-turn-helix transcriptional regulator [Phytoactinopolyspora alkaliphila]|uniref:helix-turn-helix transcriptional regulator n=1 Tax=Phytoactinopolyspora alkaliphila TaxID=1783498 RepID=UPI001C20A8F8|nr:helix-turn-helix domain-containing protein [Phytoactinopolyspora alkaliphila]
MPDELWDTRTVAEYLGVARSTVRTYVSRGEMPPPDMRLAGGSVWHADTIRAWHKNRPSQQQGGPRAGSRGQRDTFD